MAMGEHESKLEIDGPTQAGRYDSSARQFVFDPVSQPRAFAEIFEFVPVDPTLERTRDLLVDEEAVRDKLAMKRNPLEWPDLKRDAGAGRDSTGPADESGWREAGREEFKRIRAFVKCEDAFDWGVDDSAFYELRHIDWIAGGYR